MAIAAALVVVIALIITLCAFIAKNNANPPTVIDAYIDNDGTAYICYDNGKAVKLGGEATDARMTPDGKHIVVIEEKGHVYWTDASKSEKHKLAETGDNITVGMTLTNEYVFLSITDQTNPDTLDVRAFRYSFKTKKTVTALEITVKSANSEDLPFVDTIMSDSYGVDDVAFLWAYEGDISVLRPDSEKAEVISTYKDEEKIELCGVAADGKTAVWTSSENGKYSVVLCRNGSQETVSQGDLEGPDITADNYQNYLSTYLNETYDSEKYDTLSDYENAVMEEWAKYQEEEGDSEDSEDSDDNSESEGDAQTEEATEAETENEENQDEAEPENPNARTTSATPSQSTIIKKLNEYFRSKSDAPHFNVDVDPKNKIMTINGADRTILVNGDKVEENKLPSDLYSSLSYSTNGIPLYQDMNVKRAKGYYVITKDTSTDSDGTTKTTQTVYLINFKDGERVKLISDVTQCTFSEDKLLFVKDDSLRMAKVDMKKAELVDEVKVANDVYILRIADSNSNYVYFMKSYNSNDNTADLYVYDVKEGESDKIESDVYPYNAVVSTDGLSVYYYTDVASTGTTYGTLNVYNVKNDEDSTIAGDVVVGSPTSYLESGEMDAKYIWYERYQNRTDTSYEYNVCFYNGKESVSVVKNIEN